MSIELQKRLGISIFRYYKEREKESIYMTYKYFEVRREVYSKCSDKVLKKNRSFSEMKKLFKKGYWVMMAVLIGSMIAFGLLAFFIPEKPYYIIPVPVAFLVPIILEFSCEKIYNAEERKRELTEARGAYEQYIQDLKSSLASCEIDSASKRKALKTECTARLEKQAKPYNTISTNAYNILVGVPIGAIVSAIMYENNDSAALTQIVGLIMFGLLIIGFSKAFKTLTYYSDGHFKDRYLLEVLNELEYAED